MKKRGSILIKFHGNSTCNANHYLKVILCNDLPFLLSSRFKNKEKKQKKGKETWQKA